MPKRGPPNKRAATLDAESFTVTESPRVQELQRALRRVHFGVLATLVACALVVVGAADPADDVGLGATEVRFSGTALALALASILARRQAAAPRTPPRARVVFSLLGLLLAGSVGVVGVILASARDERDAALLFVLGGAILALRPAPSPLPKAGTP